MVKSFLLLFFCIAVSNSTEISFNEGMELNTRITDGMMASPGFFPYVTEIHYKTTNIFRCAGVIISANWILTVAYCLYDKPAEEFEVGVGRVNRSDPYEPGSYTANVDRYVLHSKWVLSNPYVNNIALIHLEKPLQFSDVVKAVQMTDVSTPADMNSAVTVVGWGGEGYYVSNLHFNTNFQLIDEKYCDKYEITPNSLCTNRTAPNPTVCGYDWGGPLLQLDSTKGMVLYGIVSTPESCINNPSGQAFYENIVNHRVWIYLVTGV